MLSSGTSRSPVTSSAPGGPGGPATSGGPFGSGYLLEGDRYRGGGHGRRRSGDWDSIRGGRGRSRERDYDYNRGGSMDYGRGGGFRFNDRDRDVERGRDFRDARGGSLYRDYSHRPRSPSRERERGSAPYGLGRGGDRHDRGLGYIGDRRPDQREREREREQRERERVEKERERDRDRDRDRDRERERERERPEREREREREQRFPVRPRPPSDAGRDTRERPLERSRVPEPRLEARDFSGITEPSQADRDREKRERDANE